MVYVQQRLPQVLYIDPVLGPVVLLKGLEPVAREVRGRVQVVANLGHVEVLRLVLGTQKSNKLTGQVRPFISCT